MTKSNLKTFREFSRTLETPVKIKDKLNARKTNFNMDNSLKVELNNTFETDSLIGRKSCQLSTRGIANSRQHRRNLIKQ